MTRTLHRNNDSAAAADSRRGDLYDSLVWSPDEAEIRCCLSVVVAAASENVC